MEINITEKISLTPLTMEDAGTISILVNQNREEFENYFPWVKELITKDDAENYIYDRIHSGNYGARWFSVKYRGIKSGVFGIKSIDKANSRAELGYWLTRDVRGNGITNLIIKSLSQFLAKAQGVKTIEFRCLQNNKAGLAVIQRAGGSFVEAVANDMDIEDKGQDIHIYHLQVA